MTANMPGERDQIYAIGLNYNSVPDNTGSQVESQPHRRHSSPEIKTSTFKSLYHVFICSVLASFGGILFGYDIGIVSGALLLLKEKFSLTCFEQEMVVSSVLLGAFVASFFGGFLVDKYGRRFALMVTSLIFIGGAVILSFSVSLLMILFGRIAIGIAVSISVTAECTYISEISPPKYRGMLVSLNEVGITIGFLLAYLSSYIFVSYYNGWKYMFGIGAVPACVLLLGVIYLPPSPYYLLLKKNTQKAYEVLHYLRGTDNIEGELAEIMSAIQETQRRHCCELCSTSNNMRFRMVVGMTLVFLQQATGQTNVLYYAPTIFQQLGFCSDTAASLASVGLGLIKVATVCIVLILIDRIGRRFLLLSGALIMAVSILVLGIITMTVTDKTVIKKCSSAQASYTFQNFTNRDEDIIVDVTQSFRNTSSLKLSVDKSFYIHVSDESDKSLGIIKHEKNFSSNNYTSGNSCSNLSKVPTYLKALSVVFLMTYVCAYEMSFASVTWLILSEIFPSYIRGHAVSVATCLNWGTNLVMTLSFLDLLDSVGIGETFIMYSSICFASTIFIYYYIPETKNRNLEEISRELNKKKVCCCALKAEVYHKPSEEYHSLEETSH